MLVTISDDFNLQKICDSGQCFRCKNINGIYRFVSQNHILYIKPISETNFDICCNEDEWTQIWLPYFDLTRNYRRIREYIQDDVFMSTAANSGMGIRILKQDSWEMLITFIISQRKSIPAIKKSVEALSEAFGQVVHTKYEDLYLFPSAEALCHASDSDLAKCGLGYRLSYIRDASKKVQQGVALLDTWNNYDDETLRTMLKTIKGVGDKVANCIMLFSYGRTASVPVDTWIKKIMNKFYSGTNPFLRYEKDAGIMQQYAFYYIQQNKLEV